MPNRALPVVFEYTRPNVYPRKSNCPSGTLQIRVFSSFAYFSPSWTAFQADGGRDFSVIVDGVSV
jgi:hypothetical protein